MAMQRCEKQLHFYDAEKHASCPYCRDQEGEIPETRPNFPDNNATDTKTRLINNRPKPSQPDDDGKTQWIFDDGKGLKKQGFKPVVGWLVCTAGAVEGMVGQDYRIFAGINEVGREDIKDVEIVIQGDSQISRREHAEIEYNQKENAFYLMRKKNDKVELNGKPVRIPTLLQAYDVILFGASLFLFLPLCNERFKWDVTIAQK